MECRVKKIVGWDQVLNTARTTVGKGDLNKEPSDSFKKQILISEHSPIRNLLFEVVWSDIPYWVAMHLIRHHIGFHSGEDDTFFVKTQRSDRTGIDRDDLPQNAPVIFRSVINAHSIINVSRVRLCRKAAKETIKAWSLFIEKLSEIEPLFAYFCQPNCVYRGFCPELDNTCKFAGTKKYREKLDQYHKFCGWY